MRRKKMVEELIIEESRHEAVEKMYFWPAVRERLPDGDELADTATGQEQEGKEVLDRLDELNADQPEFEELVFTFISAGRDHIAFEETKVWRRCGGRSPRTRPAASATRSLRARGPAVAASDRLRRAAAGRGQGLAREDIPDTTIKDPNAATYRASVVAQPRGASPSRQVGRPG
jgi:Hemerythrin HHE cation binding domain